MSVRAAIRAKVTAARLAQHADDEGAADSARGYLRARPPPARTAHAHAGRRRRIVRHRQVAAGARARGRNCLPAPGAVWLRSDVERKALFGAAETDRLPEAAYTREATAQVYARLADKARRALAAGHAVLVDAVFAAASERAAIAQAADGAPFHGLFLNAGLEMRIARVGGRVNDASDADAEVARGAGEL